MSLNLLVRARFVSPLLASAVVVCGSLLASSVHADPPRGARGFKLGGSMEQLDTLLTEREVTILSRGTNFVTCSSPNEDVEYESYEFVVGPFGRSQLWHVTIAYRSPYTEETFEGVEDRLRTQLGPPTKEWTTTERDFEGDDPRRQLVWVDPQTRIQLAGHLRGGGEEAAERMLLSWTDLKLQREIDAKRRLDRPTPK